MCRLKLSMMCVVTLFIFLMPLAANNLYASDELGDFEQVPISDPQTDETKMSSNSAMYETADESNAGIIPWVPECGAGGMFEDEDPPFATNVEIYNRETGEITIEMQDTEMDEAIESLEPQFSEGNSGVSLDTISSECVIGSDGRVKVGSTDNYPYRAQVKLKMRFGSSWYMCSGTMIGPYQLLTAGHCVHEGSGGSWVDELRIYPGYECGYKQWWLANATLLRSYTGWTNSSSANHDWAMVTLDRRIGNRTGWFGYLTAGTGWYDGKGFNIYGYPADKDGGACQYGDFDYERDTSEYKLYYYIDTYGGQSGSAVYYYVDPNRYEVAVHAYGHGSPCVYNSGTRLNQDKYDRIGTWKSDDDTYRPPTDKAELMDDGEVYAGFSPTSVNIGTSFSVWSDIRNVGTASASNVPVGYYASTNTTCTTLDYLIGTANVSYISAITPSSWKNADWSGTFPTNIPLGTYYLCRIIDPYNVIPEFNDPGAGNANYDSTMLNVIDTIAPSPNPMTWSTVPYEISTSEIRMYGTMASDPSTPVEYYFDCTGSTTGGGGWNDSGWQTSRYYADTGLGTNHNYCYRVRAQDSENNLTGYSSISCDYTDIETPTGITFGTITTASIQARSTNTPSGLTRELSGLLIQNVTTSANSNWKQDNIYWTSSGLSPNTSYGFNALAKNGDGNYSGWSPTSSRFTLANVPGAAAFSNVTCSSIRANWTANGNPAGTQYYCENTTAGTNSGWTTNTYWTSTGLNDSTSYSFRVKARNGNGYQTAWRTLGTQATPDCSAPIPNPMTWATEPYETSVSSISMVATTASDPTTPITYYFQYVGTPTGGLGGTSSGWIGTTAYVDSGLDTNHQYGYRVYARDGNYNMTAPSTPLSYDFTDIETPTGITFGTITSTCIEARSTNTPSGLTRVNSGLEVSNVTYGTGSGWKQNNSYWNSCSLAVNTQYCFRVRARNGDGNITPWSPTACRYTLANLPGAAGFSNITQTSIQANWTANGNPGGTRYYCENTTDGTNSGWVTNTSWNSAGLAPGTSYAFQVKARNGNSVETGWRDLGSQSTLPGADPCECDLNHDGSCDMQDWLLFGEDWGRTDCGTPPGSGNPPNDCECDLNADGSCDMQDWLLFGEDWGRTDCPIP